MFNNRVCENIVYRIHSIFIKMIRVHIFRKHPHKLEIKSGGAVSAGAFYYSPIKYLSLPFSYRVHIVYRTVEQFDFQQYFVNPLSLSVCRHIMFYKPKITIYKARDKQFRLLVAFF